MYKFSNESNFIEFSAELCLNSKLVYPLKYSFNGVKYIKRKEAERRIRNTIKEEAARLNVDDEISFFFSSVFSFTNSIWNLSESLSIIVCFFFFGINANICIVKHKLLYE